MRAETSVGRLLESNTALKVRPPAVPRAGTEPAVSAADAALDQAVNGLRRSRPEFSAATPVHPMTWGLLAVVLTALVIGAAAAPEGMRTAAIFLMTLPFFIIVQIRLAALWYWAGGACNLADSAVELADVDLPTYSVLVPVYGEVAAAPGLVAGLTRLDYPHGRLQILFITEAEDAATRQALAAAAMTSCMTILTVPDGLPRTKPRALNYGLQFARGDLVAIFDAEDQPEPDQLRRAAAAFAAGAPNLASVQARLSIYNAGETALTQQFAIEYAVLFDAVLPALNRLGLPLPLGGTSNHFRRSSLQRAGAWDAYNVTEDADLGFRLARLGYEVSVIASSTGEEAPPAFGSWLRQRTRWLKGWMQTYIVHMRSPRRLWRELGPWRFMGFQAILAGMILSARVHPLFYLSLLDHGWGGTPASAQPGPTAQQWLWGLCLANLALSYICSMTLGGLCLGRRGARAGLLALLALPIYWLAISIAAYRAVFELATKPHYWAKTEHRGVAVSGPAPGA